MKKSNKSYFQPWTSEDLKEQLKDDFGIREYVPRNEIVRPKTYRMHTDWSTGRQFQVEVDEKIELTRDTKLKEEFVTIATTQFLNLFLPKVLCALILEYQPCLRIRVSEGRPFWHMCIGNRDQLILFNQYSNVEDAHLHLAFHVSDIDDCFNRVLSHEDQKSYSGAYVMRELHWSQDVVHMLKPLTSLRSGPPRAFKLESRTWACSSDGRVIVDMKADEKSSAKWLFEMKVFMKYETKDYSPWPLATLKWAEDFPSSELIISFFPHPPLLAVDWDSDQDFGVLIIVTAHMIYLKYFAIEIADGTFLSSFVLPFPAENNDANGQLSYNQAEPDVTVSLEGRWICVLQHEPSGTIFIPFA